MCSYFEKYGTLTDAYMPKVLSILIFLQCFFFNGFILITVFGSISITQVLVVADFWLLWLFRIKVRRRIEALALLHLKFQVRHGSKL